MVSSTEEEKLSHRELPSRSRSPSQRFSVPWVGDSPNLGQRRRYMHAYLDWMLHVQDFQAAIDQLRQDAEVYVADWLVSDGLEKIQVGTFEFTVDMLVWQGWCKLYLYYFGMNANLTVSSLKKEAPRWPWDKEPETEPEEPTSKRFDELRQKSLASKGKGTKVIEKLSMSAKAQGTQVAEAVESTSTVIEATPATVTKPAAPRVVQPKAPTPATQVPATQVPVTNAPPRLPAAPTTRNPILVQLGSPKVDTVGQERILKQHQACKEAVNHILDNNFTIDDVKMALDQWLLAPRGAAGLSRNTHITLAEGVWNSRMAIFRSRRNPVAEWADSARSAKGRSYQNTCNGSSGR